MAIRDTKEETEVDLRIRCRPEVRQRFRVFVATQGFESYEDALLWLLDHALVISRAPVKTYLGQPEKSEKKKGKKR